MSKLTYIKRDVASFFRRNALAIPMGIIALCIIGIFALQTFTIGKLQDSVERQNKLITATTDVSKQILKSSKQRTDQINEVNRHMDCIVQFFAQPDRGSKSIADINKCQISENAPSSTQVLGTNSATSPAPSASNKSHDNPVTTPTSSTQPTPTPSKPARSGIFGGVEDIVDGVTSGLSTLLGGK